MNNSFLSFAFTFFAVVPSVAQVQSTTVPDYHFDLANTQYYKPASISRDQGGLVVAGSNFSSQIRSLKSINGSSIETLETLMRPGNKDERGSVSGFLGEDEKLLDVLVADNEFVRQQGLTHRQLAIPLLQISQRAVGMMKTGRPPFEFEHGGINWRVNFTYSRGYQYSPFGDGTRTQCDFTITNLENEKSLEFSGLVPLMIERYGFYEGKGTPYRVEPAEIIELLNLRTDESSSGG